MKGTIVNTTKNLPRLAAVIAVSLLALTGCTPESSTSESASRPAGETVTIEDAWVKSADEGMSAAFGTLLNSGDDDVTVVSVPNERIWVDTAGLASGTYIVEAMSTSGSTFRSVVHIINP